MSTGIEWTDETWNPVVGCKAVSPGCDHCYAAREASGRLKGVPVYAGLAEGGVFTGEVRTLPERLDQPLRWKRPRRIFVNSMSDLFHPDVPDEFIHDVFSVMLRARQHTYQILTKRPQRLQSWLANWGPFSEGGPDGPDLRHIWLGTSIESDRYTFRANHLRDAPGAVVRFLSCEPLLGPLRTLDLEGIDWVIVGGESGPKARPMNPRWVREIQDACQLLEIPFLFKQWGEWAPPDQIDPELARAAGGTSPPPRRTQVIDGDATVVRVGKKVAGRMLDGRTWDEYPA